MYLVIHLTTLIEYSYCFFGWILYSPFSYVRLCELSLPEMKVQCYLHIVVIAMHKMLIVIEL